MGSLYNTTGWVVQHGLDGNAPLRWWVHLIISLFIRDMLILFIAQQEVLYYLIKQMALRMQANILRLRWCKDGAVPTKQKKE